MAVAMLAAMLACAAGLASCGQTASSGVAVKVGTSTIAVSHVEREMSVMSGQKHLGSLSRDKYVALRREALESLIPAQWLIGAAAERGLSISSEEVDARYRQKREASFPGGEAEFTEFLKSTGQAVVEVRAEVKTELAAGRLLGMIKQSVPKPTPEQVRAYYRRHRQGYLIPGSVGAETTNRKSAAAAEAVIRRVEAGRGFPPGSLYETSVRQPAGQRIDNSLERAIFSSPLNVVTGPVKLRADYYVVEVKRIVPPRYSSFAEVKGAIATRLEGEWQRRAIAAFIAGWRHSWTARTDCRAGYVVQKCRQYLGPMAPESTQAFN